MTKLKKTELAQLNELTGRVQSAFDDLDSSCSIYNEEKTEDNKKAVVEALSTYNESLEPLNEFRQSVVDSIQEYIDGKSDRWQEGDKAAAYQDWMGAWEEEFEAVGFE